MHYFHLGYVYLKHIMEQTYLSLHTSCKGSRTYPPLILVFTTTCYKEIINHLNFTIQPRNCNITAIYLMDKIYLRPKQYFFITPF